jgi:hypothetical protein
MSESPWKSGVEALSMGRSWQSRRRLIFVDCEDPRKVSISAKSEAKLTAKSGEAGDALGGK